MVEKETDLMACDGDGVEATTDDTTVPCAGCDNCKPVEEEVSE